MLEIVLRACRHAIFPASERKSKPLPEENLLRRSASHGHIDTRQELLPGPRVQFFLAQHVGHIPESLALIGLGVPTLPRGIMVIFPMGSAPSVRRETKAWPHSWILRGKRGKGEHGVANRLLVVSENLLGAHLNAIQGFLDVLEPDILRAVRHGDHRSDVDETLQLGA